MAAKKNLSEYRTTKQLLALALSNKFTDKEYQTMRTRSEEFKSASILIHLDFLSI